METSAGGPSTANVVPRSSATLYADCVVPAGGDSKAAYVPVSVNGARGVVVPRPTALALRNVDPFGSMSCTSSMPFAGFVDSPATMNAFCSPATPAISTRVD